MARPGRPRRSHPLEEGSAALLENDGERGLRLLRELHARRPDFPELADKLAAVHGTGIDRAFTMGPRGADASA